jgi:hypothetical protein
MTKLPFNQAAIVHFLTRMLSCGTRNDKYLQRTTAQKRLNDHETIEAKEAFESFCSAHGVVP